jgi:hypothetical protein
MTKQIEIKGQRVKLYSSDKGRTWSSSPQSIVAYGQRKTMLRLELQKRFERIDEMQDPIRIKSVNLRFQGAASGGKTTTEASSLALSLSNVMGSWLNGKSDHAK